MKKIPPKASTKEEWLSHSSLVPIDSGLTAAEVARAALLMGPMMIAGRLGTGLGCTFANLLAASLGYSPKIKITHKLDEGAAQ